MAISLERRAPVGPIPTRTWHMYLDWGPIFMEYKNILEQKNPCVRSQLAHVSFISKFGKHDPFDLNFKTTSRFPYPFAFRQLLKTNAQPQLQPQSQERVKKQSLNFMEFTNFLAPYMPCKISIARVTGPVLSSEALEENQSGDLANNTICGQNPLTQEEAERGGNAQAERVEWEWGVTCSYFGNLRRWLGISGLCYGITRTSSIESKTQVQPTFVILGIFSRGHCDPQELVAFISKPENLFWELRWATFRLRGLSTLLSLRQVKGFRLYRCNAEEGTHERIHLDSNGAADLQLLLHMYKRWYVPRHIALAWANWIHQTLNNSSYDVLDGAYSLELVLDWSVTRISAVVLLPVLLSLAIGFWVNSAAWADLATIQTAWGAASYIVTAGGLLAALLAIISSIVEK